jgi:hypothetical protein
MFNVFVGVKLMILSFLIQPEFWNSNEAKDEGQTTDGNLCASLLMCSSSFAHSP